MAGERNLPSVGNDLTMSSSVFDDSVSSQLRSQHSLFVGTDSSSVPSTDNTALLFANSQARLSVLCHRLAVAKVQRNSLKQAHAKLTASSADAVSPGKDATQLMQAIDDFIAAWQAIPALASQDSRDTANTSSSLGLQPYRSKSVSPAHFSGAYHGQEYGNSKYTGDDGHRDSDEDDTALPPDELISYSPQRAQPAKSRGGPHEFNLRSTAFGGPWLPKPFAGGFEKCGGKEDCHAWTADVAAKLGPAAITDRIRSRLASCRRDRRRYFEQYLECRDLLMDRGLYCTHTSSCSAPAAPAAYPEPGNAAMKPQRASTPRDLRPVRPPPAGLKGPRGSRSQTSRQPTSRGQWTAYWDNLTATDSGMPCATQGQPMALPVNAAHKHFPQSGLAAHLERRASAEGQLRFWEHETLNLATRGEELGERIRKLEVERNLRRELDEATVKILNLLAPVVCQKTGA